MRAESYVPIFSRGMNVGILDVNPPTEWPAGIGILAAPLYQVQLLKKEIANLNKAAGIGPLDGGTE